MNTPQVSVQTISSAFQNAGPKQCDCCHKILPAYTFARGDSSGYVVAQLHRWCLSCNCKLQVLRFMNQRKPNDIPHSAAYEHGKLQLNAIQRFETTLSRSRIPFDKNYTDAVRRDVFRLPALKNAFPLSDPDLREQLGMVAHPQQSGAATAALAPPVQQDVVEENEPRVKREAVDDDDDDNLAPPTAKRQRCDDAAHILETHDLDTSLKILNITKEDLEAAQILVSMSQGR